MLVLGVAVAVGLEVNVKVAVGRSVNVSVGTGVDVADGTAVGVKLGAAVALGCWVAVTVIVCDGVGSVGGTPSSCCMYSSKNAPMTRRKSIMRLREDYRRGASALQ